MVDVRMGDQDGINTFCIEGEWLIVLGVDEAATLQEATVDQNFCVLGFEEIVRSGDFLGSSKKSKFHIGNSK